MAKELTYDKGEHCLRCGCPLYDGYPFTVCDDCWPWRHEPLDALSPPARPLDDAECGQETLPEKEESVDADSVAAAGEYVKNFNGKPPEVKAAGQTVEVGLFFAEYWGDGHGWQVECVFTGTDWLGEAQAYQRQQGYGYIVPALAWKED